MQWVVEPLAALTAGTNIDLSADIPNEDSQDIFIDPLTLFEANRFPGYDRIEDRYHATYGIRTGLFGFNGSKAEVFLGQSYRVDSNDNPFPQGSGLSTDDSDYVGQITAQLGTHLNLDYRFQLDNADFVSRRHEVDSSVQLGRFSFSNRYFYVDGLKGTGLNESREQLRSGLKLQLTDEWAVLGAAQYDFANENEGLRKASSGLSYEGQCISFSLIGERTLTNDVSGDSDTEIMARIGLKNLGEFETSGITIDSSSE